MLIESNNSIPQVYRKERTIQVFMKLLDIILNCNKYDIDNIGSVYDAYTCPENLLPFLAKTLNYQYDFNDTVTSNRRIIKIFAEMEKQRGSETGLYIASALSLSSLLIAENNAELLETSVDYLEALKYLKIYYDYERGLIQIDYPNTYMLVRNVVDYVRPVGMAVLFRAVNFKNINPDAMLIYADIENMTREYFPELDSGVSKTFVNASTVGDPEFKEVLEDLLQEFIDRNNGSNEIDLNGGD